MLDNCHQQPSLPSPRHKERVLPKRIILVRHGESAGNIDGAAYATTPDNRIPLTPQGIEQAERAGAQIYDIVSDGGACSNWKVYFYVSPYTRTRSTLRGIGRAFPRSKIIGAREECRIREQDFGNFQVAERMKVIKETRERFGRFFYRFPEGESAADVFDRVSSFLESLWRDIDMNRLHRNPADEINFVIVSHGLAIRVFLMKWFKWTVEQFELLNNLGNCEFQIMQLGEGGEYSLAVQHSEEQLREWGLSPDMIADQRWRAQAIKGDWNDSCPWYLDSFFDKFADSNSEDGDDLLSSSSSSCYTDCQILLLAILLLAAMLRRLHFSRATTAVSVATSSKRIVHDSNCMFVAHSTINLDPSSDGGCLYGNSIGDGPQMRGFQVQVFTLKEAEKATDNFSDANVVHKGASAAVYKGVLSNGTPVAIKILRGNGRSAERAFRSEWVQVDLLCRVRSPYISELLGYCADQNHRLLVFEYMPNGTLSKHLHFRLKQGGLLKWGTRLKIALDCARALEYLHEHMTPTIIHRNFKSTNILLDHDFRAKLSGFGLAKIGSDKLNGLISTRVLGTTGYLAPEYASTGKLTTKSDVYSYGVILLELLTGRVPIDTTRPPGEHVLVSWALPRLTNREKVMEMIDPALQGHYSKKDLIQVAAIAAMCVQTEADYRPLITDVVQSLMPLVKNHSLPGSSGFGHTPSPRL